MGIIIKDYTGKEIFEAIEKDGFKIMREAWIEGDGPVVSACLLGMASLNLSVVGDSAFDASISGKYSYDNFPRDNSLFSQLNKVRAPNGQEVGSYIVNKFDEKIDIEFGEIDIDAVQETFPDQPDLFAGFDAWSEDAEDNFKDIILRAISRHGPFDDSQEFYETDWAVSWYNLSWKDAVEMCREVLTPYFDHVFQLASEDYSDILEWTPPTFQAA